MALDLLEQPFFLPERNWIPVPSDWSQNIGSGKSYDLTQGLGLELYEKLSAILPAPAAPRTYQPNIPGTPLWTAAEPTSSTSSRFGTPQLVTPRLGQGSFRVLVTDAYQRRCAMTQEKTLPVLEAAHIKPYSEGGEHRVDNGLLLRSDLHVLFDRGYLTINPDLTIEVSRRIREEFSNGRDYYALHGKGLHIPQVDAARPDSTFLEWHNRSRYRG